jgi:uncharacterized SAM-binding protein YcdF (DUF218 family)
MRFKIPLKQRYAKEALLIPEAGGWNAELALIIKQFLFNAGMFVALFSLPMSLVWAKASRRWTLMSLASINVLFAFFCASRTAPFLGGPLLNNARSLIFESDSRSCTTTSLVVLGGGVLNGNILSEHSQRRVLMASKLIQKLQISDKLPKYVYLTGGLMPGTLVSEAQIMRQVLVESLQKNLASSAQNISFISEEKSKNTFENAKNTMEIVLQKNLSKKITLITSSWHLPRAVKTFQKMGFEVCAHSIEFGDLSSNGVFSFDAAQNTSRVLNEYIGMIGYQLRGWL